MFYHTHQIPHYALAIVSYALAIGLRGRATRPLVFYHHHQIPHYALAIGLRGRATRPREAGMLTQSGIYGTSTKDM